MPAYIIYARKSTESEDRQILSIDSQVNELRALAVVRGIAVDEVLTESKSAKAPGRPVFSELMRRVQKGVVHGIICWKMDRLARNHLDTGAVLQALADGKINEVITSDRTYTRDGNDRFMGSFELGMATKYIDDLRANVKRGIRARLEQGWINHYPKAGYLLDPISKQIVKDPQRFELVRRMLMLVADATHRPSQVVKVANEQWGFLTPKHGRLGGSPLSPGAFYRMLHDPFYMGINQLKDGRRYPGSHPPMLSPEEFDRIQEVLRRYGRPRSYKHHEFAFSGIFKCGHCGGAIRAEEHIKPSGKRYVYYRCTRNRKGVTCREPAIPEAEMERQIGEGLRLLQIPDEAHQWLRGRIQKSVAADEARREEAHASLRQSIAGLNHEHENLLSLRLRDLVDDRTFIEKKREMEDKRARFAARVDRPREDVRTLALNTFAFASKAAETFAAGTAVQKRMIIEAVGLNCTLASKKALWQLKTPLQIIADAGGSSNWCTCWEDLRTWFQDTTEYFRIPDEILPVLGSISPQKRTLRKGARRVLSDAQSAQT